MGSAHVNRMCGYVGDVLAMWTFELPKLTTVFNLDIYSAIWTFELPIRMIGSNQWILDLENL